MSVINRVVAENARYAQGYRDHGAPLKPRERLAVVTCMDARIDVARLLGLQLGDAHIIRNGGGVVTDDVIRSLTVSQRRTGTQHVVVIHHTECAMLGFTDAEFRAELESSVGQRPTWAVETFSDLDADVRQSMTRITTSPFLPYRDSVRGFVYDVHTGRLREVL